MNKQTKTLLLVGVGLLLLYRFKNRETQNNYSGNGEVDNQSDYSSQPGGGSTGGVATGAGGDGSGYVASGDDDTDSIANDPTTTYTGTVNVQPAKRPMASKLPATRVPLVGDVTSGMSGKPVVGKPDPFNQLPVGGKKMTRRVR